MKKIISIIAIMLLLLFSNLSVSSSEYDETDWWPMFMHDSSNTGSSSEHVPQRAVVKWRYDFDSNSLCYPIVASNNVYVTVGNEIWCLNADNGWVEWNFSVKQPKTFRSYVAVHNGKVYATFDRGDDASGGGLYCLDAENGNFLWKYSTLKHEDDYELEGYVGPPTYKEGKIYFTTWGNVAGVVHCVNAETGGREWFTVFGVPVYISIDAPAIAKGRLYTATCWASYKVYCLNIKNGDIIWSWKPPLIGVPTAISIKRDKIFFGFNDMFFCLDAIKGYEIWNFSTGSYFSTPSLSDDYVFFYSGDVMYCLQQSDGEILWTVDVEIGTWMGYPAIANETIYFISHSKVCGLNIHTGEVVWCYETNETTKRHVLASPVIADDKLYVGMRGVLYCFGLPSAKFTISHKYPNVNETIVFDASDSICDDNDEILYYKWDLDNDGVFDDAIGKTINLSFSTGGTYTIGLKILTLNGKEDIYRKNIYIDDEKPLVTMVKPVNGIYFNNNYYLDFFTTVIFGSIEIEFKVSDVGYGVKNVELLINDEKKILTGNATYIYTWDEINFGKSTVKIIAVDYAGNQNTKIANVWKFF